MLEILLIFIGRTVLECVTCNVSKTVFQVESPERTLAGRKKKLVYKKHIACKCEKIVNFATQ